MALAERLGAGSVAEMCRAMPGQELQDWIALAEMEADEERARALEARGRAAHRNKNVRWVS